MALLRRVLGETLRGQRVKQRRTLRDISAEARVSLGYLSEIERGQKEASSELLAAICAALNVRLADLLREVSETLRLGEPAIKGVTQPGIASTPQQGVATSVKHRPVEPADAELSALHALESQQLLRESVSKPDITTKIPPPPQAHQRTPTAA